MVLFFANGGGTCYVVSLGGYNADFYESYSANKDTVFANIKKEQDITMVVVPEAVNSANCMNVYTDLLKAFMVPNPIWVSSTSVSHESGLSCTAEYLYEMHALTLIRQVNNGIRVVILHTHHNRSKICRTV